MYFEILIIYYSLLVNVWMFEIYSYFETRDEVVSWKPLYARVIMYSKIEIKFLFLRQNSSIYLRREAPCIGQNICGAYIKMHKYGIGLWYYLMNSISCRMPLDPRENFWNETLQNVPLNRQNFMWIPYQLDLEYFKGISIQKSNGNKFNITILKQQNCKNKIKLDITLDSCAKKRCALNRRFYNRSIFAK